MESFSKKKIVKTSNFVGSYVQMGWGGISVGKFLPALCRNTHLNFLEGSLFFDHTYLECSQVNFQIPKRFFDYC